MHQLRSVLGPSPEDLVDVDLPRHQLRALFVVVKTGPVSVGGLAEVTGASLASTSSLADRLVRSSHLERRADPEDRRRVMLVATPAGVDVTERLEAHFHERFERLVATMTPEGRAALEAGLAEMLRAADELGLSPASEPHHPHGGSA
jgi:DNA-binding MarR family transcriptional regulator